MPDRKSLLSKANPPIGKQAKKRLDEWINNNINVPLASGGMPDTGAALSAALSAGGELLIPDDLADVAMAAVPGGAFLKAGKKGMKILKPAKTLDYGVIKKAEEVARKQKRADLDKVAETLEYKPTGEITRKKPDLWSDELEAMDRLAQERKLKRSKK